VADISEGYGLLSSFMIPYSTECWVSYGVFL